MQLPVRSGHGLPPLAIRERDFDWQRERVGYAHRRGNASPFPDWTAHLRLSALLVPQMALFLRLLDTMPLSFDDLFAQARIDIPPLLRDRVWAALLNVDGDTQQQYAAYDKTSESSYDRQVCMNACGHAQVDWNSSTGRW